LSAASSWLQNSGAKRREDINCENIEVILAGPEADATQRMRRDWGDFDQSAVIAVKKREML
jgi:hypothetical protein